MACPGSSIYATGVLKPDEAFTHYNFYTTMLRTLRHLEDECGLSRKNFLLVVRCHSKTDASYLLRPKTNYNPELIAPEKVERAVRVLGEILSREDTTMVPLS